jgi:hypothetical protein
MIKKEWEGRENKNRKKEGIYEKRREGVIKRLLKRRRGRKHLA